MVAAGFAGAGLAAGFFATGALVALAAPVFAFVDFAAAAGLAAPVFALVDFAAAGAGLAAAVFAFVDVRAVATVLRSDDFTVCWVVSNCAGK